MEARMKINSTRAELIQAQLDGIGDNIKLAMQKAIEEAYKKGTDEQYKKDAATIEQLIKDKEEEYQRGQEDMFALIRKVYLAGNCFDVTGEYFPNFIKNHTAAEMAMAFKDEPKKQPWFSVGDEVICPDGKKSVVVEVHCNDFEEADLLMCLRKDAHTTWYEPKFCTKTGRHFGEIYNVIEALKEDTE